MPTGNAKTHKRGSSGQKKKKQRLNVKLVILLLIILAGLGLGGAGLFFRQRRHDPGIYIQKGDSLVQQQEYQLAVKQYEKAFYYDQNDVKIMQKMVHVLEEWKPDSPAQAAQNTIRIIGILIRVANLDRTNTEVQKKLLELLYEHATSLGQSGLFTQIEEHADQFLRDNPDTAFALRYKALAQVEQMKRQEFDEVRTLQVRDNLEGALQKFPADPQLSRALSIWYSVRARQVRNSANSEQAPELENNSEKILTEYLTQYPDDLETLTLLAKTCLEHKKNAQAAEIIDQVEQKLLADPQPAIVPDVAAFIMATDQETTATTDGTLAPRGMVRAESLLRKAHEKEPQNLEIMVTLGQILKRTGQNDEALKLLSMAFHDDKPMGGGSSAINRKNLQLMAGTELANGYLMNAERHPEERQKWLDEARKVILKLTRELSNTALTDLLEGKLAMLEGNSALALKKLELANKKFNNTNPEPVFLSAIILKRLGETGAAAERLERLANVLGGESRIRVYRELVEVYISLRQIEKAEQAARQLLRLAPDNPDALLLRAEVMSRKISGPDSRASAEFQENVRALQTLAANGNPKASLALAQLFLRVGEHNQARTFLQNVWDKNPKNLGVLNLMVRLDLAAGKKEMAIERLDKILADDPQNQMVKMMKEQILSGKQSLEQIEEIIRQGGDEYRAAIGLFEFYRRTGQEDKALAALTTAADLRPDDATVLENQFTIALGEKDWNRAGQIAAKAAELNLDNAKGMFWLGRLELARGQPVRAVSTLKLAVSERPLYSEGWRLLGDAQRAAGDLVAAEKAYQEGAKLKPDDLRILFSLYQTHDERGLYQIALQDLQRAVALAPDNHNIYNMYLQYLGRRNQDEALRLRIQLAQKDPNNIENQREIARLWLQTGRPAEGRKIIDALLLKSPDDLATIIMAAEFMQATGELEKGVQLLETHLEKRENEATSLEWLALARLRSRANLTRPAIEAYEKAVAIEDPETLPASREMADWYFANQYFSLALPLYEKAFAKSPEPRLWLRYIDTLVNAKEIDNAEKLLKEYVAKHKHDGQSAILECVIALNKEQSEQAEKAINLAVQLAPDSAQAYVYRARINLAKNLAKAKSQAVQDLEKALSLAPDMLAVRELLARTYLDPEIDQQARAENEFLSIIKKQPLYVPARVELVQLYQRQQKHQQAFAQLTDALKIMPQVPAWRQLRGQVLMQTQKYEAAVAELKKAFDQEQNIPTLVLLGNALTAAGRPAETVALCEKFPADLQQNLSLIAAYAGALQKTGKSDQARETLNNAMKMIADQPPRISAFLQEARNALALDDLVEFISPWTARDTTGTTGIVIAQMLLQNRDFEKAVPALQNTLKLMKNDNPRRESMMHSLAIAYQGLERYAEAAQTYEEVIARKPDDFVALNNLAYIYAEQLQNPQKAVQLAEKATEIAPKDGISMGNVYDTLGWAQFKAGMTDKARISLRTSIRNAPDMAYNRYHMAQVLLSIEQKTEAAYELRTLIGLAERSKDQEMLDKARQLQAEHKLQ